MTKSLQILLVLFGLVVVLRAPGPFWVLGLVPMAAVGVMAMRAGRAPARQPGGRS